MSKAAIPVRHVVAVFVGNALSPWPWVSSRWRW